MNKEGQWMEVNFTARQSGVGEKVMHLDLNITESTALVAGAQNGTLGQRHVTESIIKANWCCATLTDYTCRRPRTRPSWRALRTWSNTTCFLQHLREIHSPVWHSDQGTLQSTVRVAT